MQKCGVSGTGGGIGLRTSWKQPVTGTNSQPIRTTSSSFDGRITYLSFCPFLCSLWGCILLLSIGFGLHAENLIKAFRRAASLSSADYSFLDVRYITQKPQYLGTPF
jgi:hypothetical protein